MFYIRIDYHSKQRPVPYWVSDLPGGRTTYLELRTRFASRHEAERVRQRISVFYLLEWLVIV